MASSGMTSRERVMQAFEHKETDKVPRWCGASDEFWAKAKSELDLDDEGLRRRFGDDFRRVYSRYKGPSHELGENITWESPFGVQRKGIGYGQPTSHPLADITSVKDAENYPWPDPDWVETGHIKDDAKQWGGEYAVLGGEWSPFWHDVIDLVGHERLYFMMYDYPETAEYLFSKVTDYYYQVSKRTFEEASGMVDIFFIGNDLGGQNGPLLGVDLFRRFLLPPIKRLIDLGHRHGLKVMMHCCGGYRPLIPDMIKAGMDGLHALQPDAAGMEPAKLKRDFGGSILLNGGIDSKRVLIDGESPEWVRQETVKTLEIMAPGGGYIGGASHDTILEETPVKNVLAMFDAIEDFRLHR